MLTLIAITTIILYLFVIGMLIYGFDNVTDFKLQDLPAKTKFSIVIPFRNEAQNLSKLLDSIVKLNYPQHLFEVILINDASEDDSVSIIENYLLTLGKRQNVKHIDLKIIENRSTTSSPKKEAITSAIKVSKFNWIVTTDADCVLPTYWLDTFDEFIQINNPNCMVAPVTYHSKTSFFNRFQSLDFLSLQGATMGGFGIKKPFMCNGANFAYRKSEFISVNGFIGNDTIASGDDVFLLEKFLKRNPKKVSYLKSNNAIVTTNAAQNMNHLIQQRLRWASKTSQLTQWFAKIIGLTVLLGNFTTLVFIPAVLMQYISLKIALALFVIKFSVDFLLLFKTVRFFKQENLLLSYLFSSVIYPAFSVYIAFLSFFKSYHWKGRTSKK